MRKGTCSECGHAGPPHSVYCAYCGGRALGWFGRLWQRMGHHGASKTVELGESLASQSIKAGKFINAGRSVAFDDAGQVVAVDPGPQSVIEPPVHIRDDFNHQKES